MKKYALTALFMLLMAFAAAGTVFAGEAAGTDGQEITAPDQGGIVRAAFPGWEIHIMETGGETVLDDLDGEFAVVYGILKRDEDKADGETEETGGTYLQIWAEKLPMKGFGGYNCLLVTRCPWDRNNLLLTDAGGERMLFAVGDLFRLLEKEGGGLFGIGRRKAVLPVAVTEEQARTALPGRMLEKLETDGDRILGGLDGKYAVAAGLLSQEYLSGPLGTDPVPTGEAFLLKWTERLPMNGFGGKNCLLVTRCGWDRNNLLLIDAAGRQTLFAVNDLFRIMDENGGFLLEVTAVRYDVEPVCQRPEYPLYCEMVAAVMMLNQAGANLTKNEGVALMPFSSDANKGYVRGDSINTVNPPPIARIAEDVLGTGVNLTGTTTAVLRDYLTRGAAAVVWMNGMHGFGVHAVTLTGYDREGFFFNDPWNGEKGHMPYSQFERQWSRRKAVSYEPFKNILYGG